MSILDIFRRGRMNGNGRARYEKKIGKEKWITVNGKLGRWITIGANGGHGGSHIFIGKKGEIIFGHHRLAGKKLGRLGQRGLFDDKDGSKEHAMARHPHVAEAAKHEGIDEADIHHLADQFRNHDEEFKHDAVAMLREAKRQIPELRNMKNFETSDYTKIPGFDLVARELASSYPALLGQGYEAERNADASDDASSEKLWSYLQAGPPQVMTEQEAYEKALTTLLENKHENPDEESGGIGDEGGDSGDFGFGAEAKSAEPEKSLANTSPDELVSQKKKTMLDMSPDELANNLGGKESAPQGNDASAPEEKPAPYSGEALQLFSSLPADGEGNPIASAKAVKKAASWVKRGTPEYEDMIQIANVAILDAFNKGQVPNDPEGFAVTSAYRKLIDAHEGETAQKRGSGKVKQMPAEFDAPQKTGKGPTSNDIQEAVGKLDQEQQTIVQGMLAGKGGAEIAAELGISGPTLSRRWQEAKKILGPALAYQIEGDKTRYSRSTPIRPEVWAEILNQARQYGPMGPEFIRSVMEQMAGSESQWDAITAGRQAYLTHGSQRHEYGPRHQPVKRIDGAVARLEALLEYAEHIGESDLQDEVEGIAREFVADDLKQIAKAFGIKRGISTKAAVVESLLAKICEAKE